MGWQDAPWSGSSQKEGRAPTALKVSRMMLATGLFQGGWEPHPHLGGWGSVSTQKQESSGGWLKRPNLGCQVCFDCCNPKSFSLKTGDQRHRGGLVVRGLRLTEHASFFFLRILKKEELWGLQLSYLNVKEIFPAPWALPNSAAKWAMCSLGRRLSHPVWVWTLLHPHSQHAQPKTHPGSSRRALPLFCLRQEALPGTPSVQ